MSLGLGEGDSELNESKEEGDGDGKRSGPRNSWVITADDILAREQSIKDRYPEFPLDTVTRGGRPLAHLVDREQLRRKRLGVVPLPARLPVFKRARADGEEEGVREQSAKRFRRRAGTRSMTFTMETVSEMLRQQCCKKLKCNEQVAKLVDASTRLFRQRRELQSLPGMVSRRKFLHEHMNNIKHGARQVLHVACCKRFFCRAWGISETLCYKLEK
jgi:hypothetical protein